MKLARDIAWWLFCWACHRLYSHRLPETFGLKLLPFAGIYAYSETWADFRDTVQWNIDGQPGRDAEALQEQS